jgi:integrase
MKWQTIPLSKNPCMHMKEKIENNKKERFLKPHEISNLKVELKKSKNKFLPYIIQLMILTGCRRGEALNAKVIHFDFGRGDWVVPLPKGGKARHIPLSDIAIQTVKATISYRSSLSDKLRNSEYLFPSPMTGEPFKQIHYSWDKARTAAHLADVRMHDLRHSFASALVNEGMTLYDVKQILGHTNIKTTERYAHLSNQRLKIAASSAVQHYGAQSWLKSTPDA